MLRLFDTRDDDGNEQARCAEPWVDPEIFFDTSTQDIAVAICADCPIAQLCLKYSIKENIEDGVWGGLTEAQRRQMIKKRVR
jgi:WhiB family redox-sensing transcriptional regulator